MYGVPKSVCTVPAIYVCIQMPLPYVCLLSPHLMLVNTLCVFCKLYPVGLIVVSKVSSVCCSLLSYCMLIVLVMGR